MLPAPMNTPAHAVLNLLLLGRAEQPGRLAPIAIGAVMPDLPMVWFYFREKVLRGVPESVIWNESYFAPGWQRLFDLFNSLPLIALGAATAWALKARGWALLFASMALHCLTDLPLHNDDAHRHFLPFSGWRFESPISYWDPRFGGVWVALAEVAMVLVGSAVLARRFEARWVRGLVALIGAGYLAYIVYVFVVWV